MFFHLRPFQHRRKNTALSKHTVPSMYLKFIFYT